MAKELVEITKFMTGTIMTPSDRDISLDAASDSLNIDPIAEDGVLKGINADKIATDKFSANLAVNASKFAVYNNSGYKQILFYDPTANKLRGVNDITTSNPTATDVSSTAETVTGVPDFEVNNQEVHVGTGNAEANVPLWAGKVTNKQWGSSISGVQRELAKLKKPGNLPPFDKVIKIGSYLYGAQDNDTRVYAITTAGDFYNSSFDIFQDIKTIAYHNETSFWVLDKISSTSAELKLVDAGSFEVTQTSTITGVSVKGNNDFDAVLNGATQIKTFAEWFEASGGGGTGGGADFITDMVESSGYLWFARGCGLQDNPNNMIRWRFLFKASIPTFTGDLSIYDVSFRTDHVETDGSTASANTDGVFYKTTSAGTTDDISVRLQIPYKCLVDGGSGAGLGFVAYNSDASDGTQTVYLYSSAETDTVALTDASARRYGIILYLSDENYYPRESDTGSTYTNWNVTRTNERLDSSGTTIGQADAHSYKLRRLMPPDNSSFPILSSVNYQGNNTFSYSYYTSLTATSVKTGIITGTNFNYPYNSGGTGGSDWGGQSLEGNTILDNTETPDYEMKYAYPFGLDTGSGTEQYLFRSSKGDSTKKFQIIKNTNSNGSSAVLTYSKETDISVTFTETGSDGSWNSTSNAKKIFYKFSHIYDGYQESPLGNTFIHVMSSATQARLRLNVKLHNISQLSKRATHLNVYCAVSSNTSATGPDGFYRLVESVKLDSSWTDGTSDDDGTTTPAWSTTKEKEILHNGKVFSSYEARVGINEQIDDTLPNYSISTSLNNQLYITNCHHSKIDDASNYLFKSKPYNYSQFDWSKDFLILPVRPTAIKSFMGRIYVFNEDNMYRIEPNNLFIEDDLVGTGCFNQETIAVSDYGMCFCDDDNIYLHDGRKANSIGDKILRNDVNSWESKTAIKSVVFDTFRKAFIIFFVNANSENRAWVYSVLRKRWDLWESSAVTAAVSKPHDTVSFLTNYLSTSCLYSNGTNLIAYLGDKDNKRSWNWTSKKLTMGQDTNNKKFYKIKLIGLPTGDLNETGVATVDDLTPSITGTGSFTQNASWDVTTSSFTVSGSSSVAVNQIITGTNIPANSYVDSVGAGGGTFEINNNISIGNYSATFTFTTPWQPSQSHTNIAQTSTNGSGTGLKCSIVTNAQGMPTFTITDDGSNYVIDEQITFTDPGNTAGTAILVVASLGRNGGVYAKIDNVSFLQSGSISESKIPGSNAKGKSLQVHLDRQTGSVDSIGVIYRRLKVK